MKTVVEAVAVAVLCGALAEETSRAEPPAGALAKCLGRLEEARRVWSETEPVFVERVYPPDVFQAGAPNAAAESVLRPVLERALGRAAAGVPDFSLTLECRTWACRMLVLQGRGTPSAGWEKALASDPEVRPRLRGTAVAARRRTGDVVGGHDLEEATVHLKLADPSGEPVRPGSKPQPPMRFDADPASAVDCSAELARVEQGVATMQRLMNRSLTPVERYHSEPANPALTADMAPRLRQALNGLRPGSTSPLSGLGIDCRGVVCQVRPSVLGPAKLDRATWNSLESRSELSARIMGKAYGDGAAYWLVRPSGSADGRAVLDGLLPGVESQPLFELCQAKHPASGHLLVVYSLPGDTIFGKPGPRDGIRLQVSGSLADSPLGRCVTEELTTAVARLPLPAERLQAHRERRYDFPLARASASPRVRGEAGADPRSAR